MYNNMWKRALLALGMLTTILVTLVWMSQYVEARPRGGGGFSARSSSSVRVTPAKPAPVYKAPPSVSTVKPTTKPHKSHTSSGMMGGFFGYMLGSEVAPEDCDMEDWLNNEDECEGVDFHDIDGDQ